MYHVSKFYNKWTKCSSVCFYVVTKLSKKYMANMTGINKLNTKDVKIDKYIKYIWGKCSARYFIHTPWMTTILISVEFSHKLSVHYFYTVDFPLKSFALNVFFNCQYSDSFLILN